MFPACLPSAVSWPSVVWAPVALSCSSQDILQQINQPLVALLAMMDEYLKYGRFEETAIAETLGLVESSEAVQGVNESLGIHRSDPVHLAEIRKPLEPRFIVRFQNSPHVALTDLKYRIPRLCLRRWRHERYVPSGMCAVGPSTKW